jgi:hypothetical protein
MARVYCAGGLMHDPMDTLTLVVLGYGQTWHNRRFACTLQPAGLTCTTTRGHGLFISRRSWRVW